MAGVAAASSAMKRDWAAASSVLTWAFERSQSSGRAGGPSCPPLGILLWGRPCRRARLNGPRSVCTGA